MTQASKVNQTNVNGRSIMTSFCQSLARSKNGMAYLAERCIPESLVEKEILGYIPPYSSHWFPLLKGRLVTPICDADGNIKALAGRQLPFARDSVVKSYREYNSSKHAQELIDKWDRAKWINEPYPKRKLLYNLHRAKEFARKFGYINLVEGYLDAGVLSCKHMENTAALCGISLTEHHAAIISRYCDTVVLLYDGDQAGANASVESRKVAEQYDLKCHAVLLPNGWDPDDFVIKKGGKNLRRAIEGMIERNEYELEIKI